MQEKIRRAIWDNRRTHIRSANAVGKTFELGSTICEWLVSHKGGRVICGGPSHKTIKRGLWSEIRRAYYSAKSRGIDLGGTMGKEDWILGDAWDAAIISVDNISNAQGARGKHTLIVIDEAQGVVDPELWTAFDSLMTDPGSRMVQSGNPLWPMGGYYEASLSAEWVKLRINGFDHPNIAEPRGSIPLSEMTPEWIAAGRQIIPGSISRLWIAEKADAWGVEDPRYTARVLGEFPEAGERQLITLGMLESCADITPKVTLAHNQAGLDVAISPTGDKNVFKIFDRTRKQIVSKAWRGHDLMETTGQMIRLAEANGFTKADARWIGVDVCGIGAGVVHRAKEAGWYVTPVDFGASPKGSWWSILGEDAKHQNHKAELHDLARYYFRHGLISVPRGDRETWADLTALSYSFDGSGNMRIDAKEKMRATIGRSPDHSDALMIALAATGYVATVL